MVAIFDLTDVDSDYTSDPFDAYSENYSVELEASGTFNIDAKLQISIGGNQWTDLSGSAFTAETSGPISWDVRTGKHNKVRMVIVVNSGSMDTAIGKINNGY